MSNHLSVYTFAPFPKTAELEKHFGNVFVFRHFKQDFEAYSRQLQAQAPSYILGIAQSTRKTSRFEPVTINQFTRRKQVLKGGPAHYPLHMPALQGTPFCTATTPTNSFCNWTMYRLSHFINTHNLPTKLMFAHIQPFDLPSLAAIISTTYEH